MTTVEELGRRAKQASRQMNRMGTKQKNQILALAAQALVDEQEEILKANAMDIKAAREKNMPEPMVDRLALSESRIGSWLEQPAHNRSVLGSSPRWSIKFFLAFLCKL